MDKNIGLAYLLVLFCKCATCDGRYCYYDPVGTDRPGTCRSAPSGSSEQPSLDACRDHCRAKRWCIRFVYHTLGQKQCWHCDQQVSPVPAANTSRSGVCSNTSLNIDRTRAKTATFPRKITTNAASISAERENPTKNATVESNTVAGRASPIKNETRETNITVGTEFPTKIGATESVMTNATQPPNRATAKSSKTDGTERQEITTGVHDRTKDKSTSNNGSESTRKADDIIDVYGDDDNELETSTEPDSKIDHQQKLPVWVIVTIVLGSLIGLGIVIGLAVYCMRKQNKKDTEADGAEEPTATSASDLSSFATTRIAESTAN